MGEDGARIQKLRDAAECVVYTPGSHAGIPVSILNSFAAPPQEVLEDVELLRERIGTTATSLLGLIGVQADPVKSREHILLSTILDQAWRRSTDLDLAALIQQIQSPAIAKVGVLDLESFFPSKERFAFAMQLNNLLAAPGFTAWLEGQPLDVGAMLHSPEGKPRLAIFSIAHLTDAERMFFVTLLLSQVLGWVRAQSGTTSLRAILYMDEIFGLSTSKESSIETASSHPAETSESLRIGSGPGDPESGRSRLQRLVQHRDLVHWPTADRT